MPTRVKMVTSNNRSSVLLIQWGNDGSNRLTSTNLVREPPVRSPSVTGVLSLRVFANDAPVEVFGLAVAQRRLRAGKDPGTTRDSKV